MAGPADAPKPDQYADPLATSPEQFALLPHDNAGPKLNAVVWTLTALSGLVLGLRVYCRLSRRKGLWWDDGFLIAAWVGNYCPETIHSMGQPLTGTHADLHHNRIRPHHLHDVGRLWQAHLGL
jgi:hypothetical protein